MEFRKNPKEWGDKADILVHNHTPAMGVEDVHPPHHKNFDST